MRSGVLGKRVAGGLVITKHGHLSDEIADEARLVCLESGHPTPDAASLEAGDALLRFVDELPEDAHLLVLISGGTSALVECLIDGVSLDDLQTLTGRLLAEGYPIGDINRLRGRLSRIKGGRLASALPPIAVTQLLISDVPGDLPADIGSGMLVPPSPSGPALADCA